eukprot:Ihof_evm2s865 gene=Ihof_evmTU2s865
MSPQPLSLSNHFQDLERHFPLRIERSEEKGRYVVAARDLKAGEIVLTCSPLALTLNHQLWTDKCNHCFKSSPNMPRCASCLQTRYCSKACQVSAWTQYHKAECGAFKALTWEGIPDIALDELVLLHRSLIARAQWLAAGKPSLSDRCTWDDIELMPAHELEMKASDPERYQGNVMLAEICLQMAARWSKQLRPYGPTRELACTLLCRMQCNDFSIWNDLLVGVGSGVYPEGALLNHACSASCVVTYEPLSHRQVFRCLRDLQEGDELTHSYMDPLGTTTQRQAKIRSMYYFDCKCSMCLEGPKANSRECLFYADVKGQEVQPSNQLDIATQCHNDGHNLEHSAEHSLVLLQKAYAIRSKLLHPLNLDLLSTTCNLLSCTLEVQDIVAALELCEKVALSYTTLYQPTHPMIGLQYFTLGDLCREVATSLAETEPDRAHALLKKALTSY